MKPLRVLAILEGASIVPSPGKTLLEFAQLARGGTWGRPVEMTIANFREPGDPTVLLEAVQAAGVPVTPVSRWRRHDRKVLGELASLARTLQPDIVETHALLSHFVARLAGLHRLAPWVAFHHGYTWPAFRTHLFNLADVWSLRAADRVVTPCDAFRRQLQRRGIPARRISTVPNSIGADWGAGACGSAALRQQWRIPADARIILSVGRLSREKGQITLLDALAGLRRRAANAHLVLVGEGPERPRIEARIRALDLTPHVTLTGRGPAEPYYGLADVVAIPSLSEGCSLVMLEAWATGVPLVATNAGGTPEIASDRKSALLVRPGDSAALANALEEVLRKPELAGKLAREGQALVRTRFTPERRARELLEIYGACAGS